MKETLLVAEDDPDLRKLLSEALSARFRVKAVPDGHAALEELTGKAFDLLLTDLSMPRMGGMELVSLCARRFPWMPTVVLTANGELRTAVAAMKKGACDYLVKPVGADLLVAKLEEALRRIRDDFDLTRAMVELMAGKRPSLHGRRFGDYVLQQAISLGAFALVVRAEDADGGAVALKLLRPDVEKRGEAIERLRREAEITVRIRHPNVVATLDCGAIEGTYYLAMEHVDGPALIDLLADGDTLDEVFALGICSEITEALVELGRRGVVHRDIKPENVLLEKDCTAKLADFGIARLTHSPSRLTGPGWHLGTVEYMAPEQFRRRDVDARADIYSLGATVYHALCGKPPLWDHDEDVLIKKRLTMEAPPTSSFRSGLGPETVALLSRMLRRKRRKRFRSADELLAACKEALFTVLRKEA